MFAVVWLAPIEKATGAVRPVHRAAHTVRLPRTEVLGSSGQDENQNQGNQCHSPIGTTPMMTSITELKSAKLNAGRSDSMISGRGAADGRTILTISSEKASADKNNGTDTQLYRVFCFHTCAKTEVFE